MGCYRYAAGIAADVTRPVAARWLLALAALVGAAYWAGALARSGIAFDQLAALPKPAVVAWKGLATGLLVLSAFAAARTRWCRLLAWAVAVIWFADLWLAVGYTVTAGVIFVVAHLMAIRAYIAMAVSHPLTGSSWALQAIAAIAGAAVVGAAFRREVPVLFALYPAFSAICALVAARSSMPLMLSAFGTLVFFVSDAVVVLSFASENGRTWWGWLSWFTYFAGLTLVVSGIVTAAERTEARNR